MKNFTKQTTLLAINDVPDAERRSLLKMTGTGIAAACVTAAITTPALAQPPSPSNVQLGKAWDKTFPKSDKIVTALPWLLIFINQKIEKAPWPQLRSVALLVQSRSSRLVSTLKPWRNVDL